MFLSAEDTLEELHRRLDICASIGISLEQLDDLHLIPLEDLEPMLAMFDKQDPMPTSIRHELVEQVERIRPKIVAPDT